MMGIAEGIRFEALKGMVASWPAVLQRVRALEEALHLPEPPCEHRHIREPRVGVLPGISLPDFDSLELVRELNSEFGWVRARLAAIAKAAGPSSKR